MVAVATTLSVAGLVSTRSTEVQAPISSTPGRGNDIVDGSAGNDRLIGYIGADTLHGGDGDDWVAGSKGHDTLFGGDGDDTIIGGSGSDEIQAGPGHDTIHGNDGNDTLDGGAQGDRMFGGHGNDIMRGRYGNDLLNGGAGTDLAWSGVGWDSCISVARRDGCEGPTFLATFDVDPTSPRAFQNSAEFSVSVNSRIGQTQQRLAPMDADHGTKCERPPSTHTVTEYQDAVFQCRSHLMTAVSSGLFTERTNMAVAMFSPNQVLDFSGGPAVIRFDASTKRASRRDWYEIWVTPFRDVQRIPIQADRVIMQGPSENALVVGLRSFNDKGVFDASIFRDFNEFEIPGSNTGFETVITPSTMRSTFEIIIERDHLKVWMPETGLVWIDQDIPDLGFNKGVVQFGHNSYEVFECASGCDEGPATWHWDNIELTPAEPMAALAASDRFLNAGTSSFVSFPEPAPKRAWVQFTAIGKDLEVSFDGGATWLAATTQHDREVFVWRYRNYWMAVPRGTTRMHVRGTDTAEHVWQFQDISILARENLG